MKVSSDSNIGYLDYVCVDAMGDILKPQYVTEHFKVILERNGLKKIRFHDLRHSCASLMLANDISMKEIQEWLGHSNISTTANIYAHVDREDLFEYIDKAERSDPSIQLPSGLFSSRKTKTHREESSVIAPCIIHQKPSDDFRDWISDEWYDIEEMLPLKDVPKLIGYNEKTIQRWAHQKSELEVSLQHAVEVSAGTYRGQSDRRMRDEANFLLRSSVFFRSVRQSGKPDEGAALNES